MRLSSLRWALLAPLALTVGLASVAEAQTNPLGLTVAALEGPGGSRTTAEGINRGFSSLDCADAASAFARVVPMAGTNITTGIVDVWMVTDSTDCSTTDARNPDTGTCVHVGAADVDSTDSSFDVQLANIDAAATTAICTSTARTGVTVRLFAFATGNVEDRGDVGSDWGQVSVIVDPTGPVAPELDSTTAAGDNEVSISWSRVSDMNEVYRIYSGGPCGTGIGGGDGGTGGTDGLTLVKETSTGTSSTTVNPENLGLATGEDIEIYVVAVDQAGNEGEPAGPICVTRMELSGFCDEFSDCESGCTAGGVPPSSAAWPLLALGLLGLRRKRR